MKLRCPSPPCANAARRHRIMKRGTDDMQKITPFLWFDGKAEEAMHFYASVFKNAEIGNVSRWGDAGPGPKGSVMSATFSLAGQEFMALNGETQAEVDELWEKLCEGGKPSRCGWLQDKYGLSWQIIPSALGKMLQDKDAAKSARVMQAMMQMVKIDVKVLKEAYDGDSARSG